MPRLNHLLTALTLFAAQSALAAPTLYAVNPFSNSGADASNFGLYALNPANGAVLANHVISVPGRTVTGANGLTMDPATHTAYAIVKAQGVSGRLLITLDLETGVGTEVGNLGDNFSSIAFRSDGQLFGVTGDGASVPETLYMLDKATAARTAVLTLGNGADGEVIAYRPDTNEFHHFSGNSTVVHERFSANAPYVPITNVSGNLGSGEVFGAVWDPSQNLFYLSNISSQLQTVDAAGTLSPALGVMPQDMRGMILQLDQTITGFAPPSSAQVGSAPLTLTATPGASVRPVVFSTTSAATICTVVGDQVNWIGPGTCTLVANQEGDASYASAAPVTADVQVLAAPVGVPALGRWALAALAAMLLWMGIRKKVSA